VVSRFRFQLAAAALFALAWFQLSALAPAAESGILPIDPPTPFIRYYSGRSSPIGRVLMIHGLDVSKETTSLISTALADGGFDVYAMDLPGHGDSPARFQTDLAQQAIRNAKAFSGGDTIVVGHSLGAGLLMDMAATDEFSTMVLLAPPPISISEIHAERVLIATGDYDIPRIRAFAAIATDIGEPKVESWLLARGAHSAPIFNPVYVRNIVNWLGGDGGNTKTVQRIIWLVLMLVASVAFGASLLRSKPLPPLSVSTASLVVRYVVACALSLFTLKFANPMSWLRLFATDYLIGFLLLMGAALIAYVVYEHQLDVVRAPYRLHVGLLAAAYVVCVPILLVASRLLHLSLAGDGRWWRFPVIALAGLPLFIADEILIRGIQPRWKADALAILTRGLILVFILTGVLTLNRESAFLLLIVPLLVFFWIGLWFAAGVVHRHTQSALAAAVFAALVQGWVFAGIFVTV
jgi:pimeloyl-ACP methyl ester carboxylesterase